MKIYNLSALAALLINASISSLFCYPLVMLPRYPCLATRALDFPLRGIVTTIQVKTKKFGEIKQKVNNSKDILDRWLKTCNCAIIDCSLFQIWHGLFFESPLKVCNWRYQGFWLRDSIVNSAVHPFENDFFNDSRISDLSLSWDIGKQIFQNE